MRSLVPRACQVLWLILPAGGLGAQSLPLLHPVNPVVEARTAVHFQPYLDPFKGWRVEWGLDYASMTELGLGATQADTAFLLDAEVYRGTVALARNLDARNFLLGEVAVGGAIAGGLDGFLDWYHGIFGINFPERESRGHNQFAYRYQFQSGFSLARKPKDFYLADTRLGIGRRFGRSAQSVLVLTIPTSTAPDGYGRGTVAFGLLNTGRAELTPRLWLEGSANLGFTPRHGELARFQNRFNLSLTSGLRWRFWGRLSAFGNFYFATPYYHDTHATPLDRSEFTLDFGWILATHGGKSWRIGMTEDPRPTGPAIDLDFRLGGVVGRGSRQEP